MCEYLKMADVFSMGVVQEDSFLVSKDGEDLACFICYLDEDRDLMAKYASHAINSHDELVAEVERLNLQIEDLLRCVDLAVMSGDLSPIYGARKKYITD